MRETPKHKYIILTKRAQEMFNFQNLLWKKDIGWPKNLILGVSIENQQRADERILILLKTTAKTKAVSIEPMLDKIDLRRLGDAGNNYDCLGRARFICDSGPFGFDYTHTWLDNPGIDWIIVGGESGHKARP